jgi:hypothetical protein
MIAFTSDIDWAPEPVILDMLSLFEEAQQKCTLFATHRSEAILNCNRKYFEIAIHPNINPAFDGKEMEMDVLIDDLMEIYPEAKGIRCHSLVQSSHLMNRFAKRGFVYDSNQFLPYWKNLRPYKLWNGLVEIPFNWEDDIHYYYGYSFDNHHLEIDTTSLNVFSFHPVHVFLNTENEIRYNLAKEFYQQTEALLKCRNTTDVPGSRNMLVNLMKMMKKDGLKSMHLSEIAEGVK